MKNEYEKINSIIDGIREEIPQKMQEQNIPGLAAALVSKDQTLWLECFGYTDMSREHPVNTDTLFSLQSTTKTVTAVAFLLAVQKGLVALDDSLTKYYPEFRIYSRFGEDQYKKIRFRHLLSHTSGLVREGRLGGCFNYDPCTFKEHIQSISDSWQKFPAGEGISYSNAGMNLVSYALERITGMHYPDYVQKALGDPLRIQFHFDTKKVYEEKNTAKGHLGKARALPVDPCGFGCGAAHLSIKDQAAFVKFLLNSGKANNAQVLAPEYISAMSAVDKEGWYGLGTFVSNRNTIILFHPGGGFGIRSEMYWVPEHDIGVAVFTNQESPMEDNYIKILAKKVLEEILKAKGGSLSPKFSFQGAAETIERTLLERLTGVYSGFWGSVSVVFKDGKLYLDYPGSRNLILLKPHSATAFSAETRSVTFQLDRGTPVSLKVYLPQEILHMDYRGKPPEGPGPNKKEWKKFAGLYWVPIYGTEPAFCAVTIEGDGYLHFKWWVSKCLYPQEESNVFFMFSGDPVVFEEDHLYCDNIKWEKIDNPVIFIKELLEKNPQRPDFKEWVIDEVFGNLKYLKRHKDAEKVLQLRKK